MLNEFDHRVLGEKYNLFSFFDDVAPGMPVWLNRGLKIRHALIEYWRKVHLASGYEELLSPILLDKSLWQRSGHCDYFAENMFFSEVEKRDYVVKPMSCPGAILAYKRVKRSHAELPLRLCEMGQVHRNESSGALHGLMRVRSFVQDDAHIFCKKEDLLVEVKAIIELIEKIMGHCELDQYHFELSLPADGKKQYLGAKEQWQFAIECLEQAAQEMNHNVIKVEGEAKFYGPSLDVHIKDIHGRSWQCSSIQLDFNLPQRFDLSYFDEHGNKQVPYMLHRAIYGSLERFIGILLENFGRKLPMWMHPEAYRVLCLHPDCFEYAKEVQASLQVQGLQASIDSSERPLKAKLKSSYDEMVHSVVVIGEKERKLRQYQAQPL